MILYIKTDLKDTAWLQYILDEFQRTELCEFSVQAVNTDESINSDCSIYYLKNLRAETVSVPCRAGVLSEEVEFLSENLFIIKGTSAGSGGFSLNYDLFWNAFVYMSRLEEFSAEQSGKKIRSYSLAHPRKDKSTFSIPVVNHLFIDLKSLISASFSALKFGRKKKPTIEFSHDIDYIRKTIQLRLKQTAFNSFKTLRSVSRPASFFQNFRKTFSFFLSSPDYWPFDFWEQADAKYNIQSVFYIYAAAGQKNFRSWLIDPSYDIRRDRTVRNALRRLISMGFKAGLHGSYRSAVSEIQLKTEKEILAETSGTEITMTRQHWLNYEENITPYIHEKLFAFDSTLGWNDRIGFRSGFASQYRPYDHRNRRPFDYFITPQIIMDSNIYDYGSGRESELENKSVQILENLESFSSSFVSISWHDRVFTEDYGWFPFYERIQKLYG